MGRMRKADRLKIKNVHFGIDKNTFSIESVWEYADGSLRGGAKDLPGSIKYGARSDIAFAYNLIEIVSLPVAQYDTRASQIRADLEKVALTLKSAKPAASAL